MLFKVSSKSVPYITTILSLSLRLMSIALQLPAPYEVLGVNLSGLYWSN